MVSVTPHDVVNFLQDSVVATSGAAEGALSGVSSSDQVSSKSITLVSNYTPSSELDNELAKASVIITSPDFVEALSSTCEQSLILGVQEPRLEFSRVVERFFVAEPPVGVSEGAHVSPTATIGESVSIAPGCYVGNDVIIGARTQLQPNVVVLDKTVIGSDCVIGANTSIGNTGFGYSRDSEGYPVLFPHTGRVVIGDRVEIGSNTAIDRGTINSTVIENDVKIDNLVHIAHNCVIGEGSFVIATAIVSGSVRIGPRAWIAPNATIRQKVKIGEDALVGLGAVVVKDVAAGSTVLGNPARAKE